MNIKDKIFKEFISYFKFFIKSKCLKEALEKNSLYENIIKLIENDEIIDNFLNSKYLKSIPLFDFCGSGYTNKDLLISCITGLPILIKGFKKPESLEDYYELKNLIFLFNVGMKMITTLHEFIIHLLYGYLNIVSDREILSISPKKGKNFNSSDGGLYFEQMLFGRTYGDIGFNDILVILNGEKINSLNEFQNNLNLEFSPHSFKVKSVFLKSFLKEYPITLNNYNQTKIYSTMKSINNKIYISRSIYNILRPYAAPFVYNKNE